MHELSNNRSPGTNNTSEDVLKSGGEHMCKILMALCELFWDQEKYRIKKSTKKMERNVNMTFTRRETGCCAKSIEVLHYWILKDKNFVSNGSTTDQNLCHQESPNK